VNYLPYVGDPNYGNCEVCGCFRNITSAVLAAKQGYVPTEIGSSAYGVVQSIRTSNQKFKAEVPMDQILKRLEQGQSLGKRYNPNAFYVKYREHYIDWMSNLCGELRHQTETFHHSVNTFDSFMQRPDNMRHLQSISFFQGQSERNVLTLIAVTCIFISAKYHE
jgi:hypothetical protein